MKSKNNKKEIKKQLAKYSEILESLIDGLTDEEKLKVLKSKKNMQK